MDIELLSMAALAACDLLLLLLALSIAGSLRREQRRQRELIHTARQDLNALCSGASGVGLRLDRMDQRLRRVFERQDQLEMREPDTRSYDRAIKLLRRGKTVDEVMSFCVLKRAEVELLAQLHGIDSARPGSPPDGTSNTRAA
jgi:hypothetical protein